MIDATDPPATAVADVQALRGGNGVLSPPFRSFDSLERAVRGPAGTVTIAATVPGEGRTLDELYELLDTDLHGEVLVLAGAEDVEGAVWGQIVVRAARRAGLGLVVVAGAVRDLRDLDGEGVPVWGIVEGTVGPIRTVRIVAIDRPVVIAGVRVDPRDEILADASGLVALRRHEAEDVIARARDYAAAERALLEDLAAGVSLVDAYERKREAVQRVTDD